MQKILVLLLAVILSTGMFAVQRTVDEAAAIAEQFSCLSMHKVVKKSPGASASTNQVPTVRLVRTQNQPKTNKPAFYVFNRGQEGFVIVSADDKTRDILAYSEEEPFPEQVPDNVQFLLNYIAERVTMASQSSESVPVTASYTPVVPLLNGIEWDQDAPYWNMCPTDVDGKKCYTGCAATAAAQIMRYWNWPVQGKGSHSYYSKQDGEKTVAEQLSANFGVTFYDWANMPKKTSGYTTAVQTNAVATLMYHIGVSVDMTYSGDGSGAFIDDMADALVKYFGYKNTLEYVQTYNYYTGRQEETASTTAKRMREDLDKGHPVFVGGYDADLTSGHAFVFEGYNANGLFYVNWGWSGRCNGYYAIDNLVPEERGIGAGDAGVYSYFLDYIIGIEPDGSVTPPTPPITQAITGLQYNTTAYMDYGTKYWYMDLYKDWDGETTTYPEVVFYIVAKSKTTISGTYNIELLEYTKPDQTVVKDDGNGGTITITRMLDGRYRFEGAFHGDDGVLYTFNQVVAVNAYDYDNDYAEITLKDPTPNVPTISDLAAAGYSVSNARVICIYPDEQVCNPIVWAGTYNGWNVDPAKMLHFEPLTGFDGWYVVAISDGSADVQGKPVQLKLDGSFSWESQSGDAAAWININQQGTQTATIVQGYEGEADCHWPYKGVYIYELAYWKNHNVPCVTMPKHDYSISLYAPKFCDSIAQYADSVYIVGSFDNWGTGIKMQKTTDNNNKIYYSATLLDVEEGTEFKFRCGTMNWDVQILYDGLNLANNVLATNTHLVYHYENAPFAFAACSNLKWFDIVVNSANPDQGVAMGGGSYEEGSKVMIMAANTDENYIFDKWQDGNTAAARMISADKSTTYTAYFVPRTAIGCVGVASNDETLGSAVMAVMAVPTGDGTFLRWDDDNTDNPRIINELDGTIYTAIFATNPTNTEKVDINDGRTIRKIIKDDRLYIIRNGIEYIATGSRSK